MTAIVGYVETGLTGVTVSAQKDGVVLKATQPMVSPDPNLNGKFVLAPLDPTKGPYDVVFTGTGLTTSVDSIGRAIALQLNDMKAELKVAGVFRDIPANSHFTMDVVGPFETMGKLQESQFTEWTNSSYYTYVLLKDGADPKALESNLSPFVAAHRPPRANPHRSEPARFFLQPLTRIHLHSRANFDFGLIGDARFVLLFASIAVLVLVIACVNYMNLATARSLKRAKEVGLRKVVGAGKGQLVRQFLGDAVADCPKPVIAATHGYCIGGGIDLITACDIRYASAETIFSIRETRIAIVALDILTINEFIVE